MAGQEKPNEARRARLEQLVQLAATYRGLSRNQIADALGRKMGNEVPESGNPKLDLVYSLAQLLDWPVGEVAELLMGDAPAGALAVAARPYDEVDQELVKLHRAGRYRELVDMARAQAARAKNPQERAVARQREFLGWDGLGRYSRCVEALRSGLREKPISRGARLILTSNLAFSLYSLGQWQEARGIAVELAEFLDEQPPKTEAEHVAHAEALSVVGQCERVGISEDELRADRRAARSIEALQRAEELFGNLHKRHDDPHYAALAKTCEMAMLEPRVFLKQVEAAKAVETISGFLDGYCDPETVPSADWLATGCWTCVYGCNIALRHLPDREMNRAVAVFSNKGYELADRLDDWALRERLFTIEFLQRQRVADLVGAPLDWSIDHEEVRTIVGTMGRIPAFRDVGWHILNSARIITGGAR